jgi:uncharacterized protein
MPQSQPSSTGPLNLWIFGDGKPGHENQSRGLAEALAERVAAQIHEAPPVDPVIAILCMASRSCGAWIDLPRPDLVIGAGHAVHFSLIAARRIYNCKAVVLMRPSLPLRMFDLCLIPRHDQPPKRKNVVPTVGALNRVRPSQHQRSDRGLFLIGGPSKHHGWDDGAMVQQLRAILEADAAVHWTLTTSRRTPEPFLDVLATLSCDRLAIVPAAQTPAGWVAEQLAQCAQVWVSQDSVSMVYESLSSGAAVGLLDVPRRGDGPVSRLVQGLEDLKSQGLVTPFDAWRSGQRLCPPEQPLMEAQRCSEIVIERFGLSARGASPMSRR